MISVDPSRFARIARAVAGGAFLLGMNLAVGCQGAGAGNGGADSPPPLAVAGVGCLGWIEPASRVRQLGAPESGGLVTLAELSVREGDHVESGQLLGWFSDRDTRAAALRQAEAGVARREAVAKNTRAELERVEKLSTEKIVAMTELDSRRAAGAAAAAEVASAHAAVERARAELALAELRAPIAGTVLTIHTWPGEKVGEQGVLDLGDVNEMHVVAEVYETDVARVHLGQGAEIILPGTNERLRGEVVATGWQVRKRDVLNTDPVDEIDSRVVEVRIRLEPEGAKRVSRLSHMRVQVVIGG